MSYIEFWGTIFNLAGVYLMARRNILTWPVGIIGVILFAILFYQIQLYSDAIEQIYYFGSGIYGWLLWSSANKLKDALPFRFSRKSSLVKVVMVSALVSLAWGYAMSRIHLYFPSSFPQPADFPYLDAATTIFSFSAQLLMVYRRTESWIYWIVIDVVGVVLYFVKGVYFVSLLYVLFLGLAAYGLHKWMKGRTIQEL